MIYHGVRTEEAVLMRMNAAPRSVAERLGEKLRTSTGKTGGETSVNEAREFLRGLDASDWNNIRPETALLSGAGYQKIWGLLSGEKILNGDSQ